MSTAGSLSRILATAKEMAIDSSSKIVLMSDIHRSNNSWSDDFAPNMNIYSAALKHYFQAGFTYIEVGDGDELWENRRFSDIRKTYGEIFALLSLFFREKRFYMIYGNHDIVKKKKSFRQKNLYNYFDEQKESYQPLFPNIECYEGLVLNYLTRHKILLAHGHQGDVINDLCWPIARTLVRYIWRPLELYLGFHDPTSPAQNYIKKQLTEKVIAAWAKDNKVMIITGHTHRPAFPQEGAPPYFNCGCAVSREAVTAIEIENGQIALVRWSVKTNNDHLLYVAKDVMAGAKRLEELFSKFK